MLVDGTGKRVKICAGEIVDYDETATIYNGIFYHNGIEAIFNNKTYEVSPNPLLIFMYDNQIVMLYPTKVAIFNNTGMSTHKAKISIDFRLFYSRDSAILYGNPNFYRITNSVTKIGKIQKNSKLIHCQSSIYIYEKSGTYYSRPYPKISLPKKLDVEVEKFFEYDAVRIGEYIFIMNGKAVFGFRTTCKVADVVCDEEYALFTREMNYLDLQSGTLTVEREKCLTDIHHSYVNDGVDISCLRIE